MDTILVISAHPDDEILGLGGTLIKRRKNGDKLICLILGEGAMSRDNPNSITELHDDARKSGKIIGFEQMFFEKLPDNKFDSVPMLSVVKIIESYIQKFAPTVVYTHHGGDRNVDHKITFEATLTATRPTGNCTVKEVYSYETPSSTEWDFSYKHNAFSPNVFEDITDTIEKKLEAMACYKSELGAYPHPRSLEALEVISKRWGTVCGKNYAEAFELIRLIR